MVVVASLERGGGAANRRTRHLRLCATIATTPSMPCVFCLSDRLAPDFRDDRRRLNPYAVEQPITRPTMALGSMTKIG